MPHGTDRTLPSTSVVGETRPEIFPRREQVVYWPEIAPIPMALEHDIAARHLVVTVDGRIVVAMVRGPGATMVPVHSDPSVELPRIAFSEAMIVQAFLKRGAIVWGRRDGVGGIWKITGDGATLIAHMDRVQKMIRAPCGTSVVVGVPSRGLTRYVADRTVIDVADGSCVVFRSVDRPDMLIPLGRGPGTRWARPRILSGSAPDGSTDWVGRNLFPLPFRSESAAMFFVDGTACYLLRDAGADRLAYPDGIGGFQCDALLPGTGAAVEGVWNAPFSTPSFAMLLRFLADDDQARRALIVWNRRDDGEMASDIVLNERFAMGDDGFRWSPCGKGYVAHATRLDRNGKAVDDVLVTDGKRTIVHHRPSAIREARVDDSGRLAYVVSCPSAPDGSMRCHLVVDGRWSPGYEYAWNARHVGEEVSLNALSLGKVVHMRF
jgi:hypothetical protein